jgi:hypothetical protein
MKKLISIKLAVITLIILMSLLILYHILILIGIIPSDFVWSGRLENQEQVIQFEAVAIFTSIIVMIVITQKMKYLKQKKRSKVINIGLWIIFAYFVFNIVGNLTSKTTLETIIFTPVSIVLSLLILRLASEK